MRLDNVTRRLALVAVPSLYLVGFASAQEFDLDVEMDRVEEARRTGNFALSAQIMDRIWPVMERNMAMVPATRGSFRTSYAADLIFAGRFRDGLVQTGVAREEIANQLLLGRVASRLNAASDLVRAWWLTHVALYHLGERKASDEAFTRSVDLAREYGVEPLPRYTVPASSGR